MIVTEIEISGYKQFADCHLEIPPHGIVGVIGPNGAGKTTLFEAIEWCLYNPREIKNEEVPPHGGTTPTCVRVVLQDPVDGVQYVVERKLRGRSVTAEVYRTDDGQPIVQGSRQVTEYVSRQLIGLGHQAFVSTFFTRQKELSFFGTMRDTERRREVARLLGLETIRLAQESIGEDRRKAKAEADHLQVHYAREMDGRDFAAEIAAATAEIITCQATIGETETALSAANAEVHAARQQLDAQHELERRDHQVELKLQEIDGKTKAAVQMRAVAAQELTRLDTAAAQRDQLAPVAARAIEWRAVVTEHKVEHERFNRRQHLDGDLATAQGDKAKAVTDLAATVHSVPADPALPEWSWSKTDAANPLNAALRLVDVVAALDVEQATAWADTLRDLTKQLADCDDKRAHRVRLDDQFQKLTQEREKLLAHGNPTETMQEARAEREAALETAQTAETLAKQAATNAAPLRRLAISLREHQFDENCPTCGRPFVADEVEGTLHSLDTSTAQFAEQEQTCRQQAREARKAAEHWAGIEQDAQQQVSEILNLNSRLEVGMVKVADARQQVATSETACAEAMQQAGLSQPPTPEMVSAARDESQRLQKMRYALSGLQEVARIIEQCQERTASAERELFEIGPVVYNKTQHDAAQSELERAEEAATRIDEIEQQLGRRPEYATRRDAAQTELSALANSREQLALDQTAIGFDPVQLTDAIEREDAANQAERAAMTACESARANLKESQAKHGQLVREEQRLQQLLERADARAREADQLDRMYKEFTLFDKHVANIVAPRLADQTGMLLREVTDGKYDRVTFDENYGLKIYDGEQESYPVAEFSGGERDIAALCARIALSQLIGARANRPPSFLVLDEVFGSLDRERRQLTLETIGTLTANAEAFRQVFIISHVDDVRFSPILDVVWRIVETADGISTVEQITAGMELEEV